MRWQEDARCHDADPELFFERPGEGNPEYRIRAAKAFCDECPVRIQCLNSALSYERGEIDGQVHYPSGIWGGLTPAERATVTRACRTCGLSIPRVGNRTRYCEPCGVKARAKSKKTYDQDRAWRKSVGVRHEIPAPDDVESEVQKRAPGRVLGGPRTEGSNRPKKEAG